MPTPEAPVTPGDHPGGPPDPPTGILLMTYGSAANAEEVPAYLRSVRGGRDADPELVAEFHRRYRLIGWSPLVRITTEQGAELQRLLDATRGPGRYRVEVGMLHSEPRIDEATARLAVAGVRRLVGIVLSPQWSPVIMGGYRRALDAAAWRLGPDAEVVLAGSWHRTPAFLDALSEKVTQALDRLGPEVPVLFTAHSLPRAVVDRDPGYLDQIAETIDGVVERTGLDRSRWQFAYQSAGHSPEEWLKPDLKDLLPGLRADGHQAVLVVPVQFLADHLEILYDIDIAATGCGEVSASTARSRAARPVANWSSGSRRRPVSARRRTLSR
ncbi:MAG: ferrochelatase [Actinomycetia bacterium]|nr:ferrochelatase [Actinomycetes bacterium]